MVDNLFISNHQLSAVVLAGPEMQVPGQQWPTVFSEKHNWVAFCHLCAWMGVRQQCVTTSAAHQLITDWQ